VIKQSFNPSIPELYSVEVSSACNFDCPFCPRTLYNRKPQNIDINLARTIAERDLGGSYFVEFQLSGEPLLHPQLSTIIDFYKGTVLTGLSTNGSLIHRQLDALCKLDYLTVSVDAFNDEDYKNLRAGGTFSTLVKNIELLLSVRTSSLSIDLQIIELNNYGNQWKKDLELLQTFVQENKWDINIRTVPDCSLGTKGGEKISCTELCLNPWMSATVHSDGDVVPCCFSFGKDLVIGNLNDDSLENIWKNSEELQKIRTEHLTKQYRDLCSKCYMHSPSLLHFEIYKNTMKRKLNAL